MRALALITTCSLIVGIVAVGAGVPAIHAVIGTCLTASFFTYLSNL